LHCRWKVFVEFASAVPKGGSRSLQLPLKVQVATRERAAARDG
jgi:hypothetical protein